MKASEPGAGQHGAKYEDLQLIAGVPGVLPSPDEAVYTIGTLSRIDDDALRRGFAAVQDRQVFSLNAEITEIAPALFGRTTARHSVIRLRDGAALDDRLDDFYLQGSSQWDGLAHVARTDGLFYGGATLAEVESGARDGMERVADVGIVTRGILVDAAGLVAERGGHDRPVSIGVADLEESLSACGLEAQRGDILVLYTGYLEWYRALDVGARERLASTNTLTAPGLERSRDMVSYLYDAGFAAIASDLPALEQLPQDRSAPFGRLHSHLIGNLGMSIGELWDLRRLADHCRAQQRAAFLLTSAPANLRGGIGSPANALAVT